MLSEQRVDYEDRERPWTVPALVALGVVSWLVSAVFDLSWEGGADRGWDYAIMSVVLAAIFARGLWLGRRWAYVITVFFGGFSLLFLVPYLLSDRAVLGDALWLTASSLVHFYLLFHPLTRAYFKPHPLIEASDAQRPNR